MGSTTQWFQDPDEVLRELANERRQRGACPHIPGYDQLTELRRGGQGVVFTARQRSTRRTVAIKVVLEGAYASAEARLRFRREIELVAHLRHPGIVRVYDSGLTEDDHLYLVMEYIDGRPLDDHLNAGRFGPAADLTEMLGLLLRICQAVQYAHQHGIIHRDIKPSNILIDAAGDPHVLDFGLAKAADGRSPGPPELGALSMTGRFMGSLPWASPEQVQGRPHALDVRTDVYSLGIVFYQMLTGRHPYDVTGNLREAIDHITLSEPQRPSLHNAKVDDELDTIVLKCLAKDPDRRYQSAGDLARDVQRYLAGDPIEAKADSTWYNVRKLARRHRTVVSLSLVLLAVVLAFSVTMTLLYTRARAAEMLAARRLDEADTARRAAERARTDAEQQAAKAGAISTFLEHTLSSADPAIAQPNLTVREVLDQAAAEIGGRFARQPELQASLGSLIGWTYFSIGETATAERELRLAVERSLATLGAQHPDTLAIQHRLAQVLLSRGQLAEARSLIDAVLAAALRVLGPDDWMTLSARSIRASYLHAEGRFAEAEALYREVIASSRGTRGPADGETLVAMSNLAVMLQELGRYAEAEALYTEVLERRRGQSQGRGEFLTLIGNLAAVYSDMGRLDEAESLLREGTAVAVESFGPDHPRTINVQHNFISVLMRAGRLAEAEHLLRELLGRLRLSADAQDPDLLQATNQLCVLLLNRERWAEAAGVGREVLERFRRRPDGGGEAPPVVYQNLAAALSKLSRPLEAEMVLREGMAVQDEQYGREHPAGVWLLHELGKSLMRQERFLEAWRCFEQARQLGRALLGNDHWVLPIIQIGLARALAGIGRIGEAEALLESTGEWYRVHCGPDCPETRRCADLLAAIRSGGPVPD